MTDEALKLAREAGFSVNKGDCDYAVADDLVHLVTLSRVGYERVPAGYCVVPISSQVRIEAWTGTHWAPYPADDFHEAVKRIAARPAVERTKEET